MTLPKDRKIQDQHIESMKIAVEQADIRSIHPDKMEEFAEYLVRQARTQELLSQGGLSPSFFCAILSG